MSTVIHMLKRTHRGLQGLTWKRVSVRGNLKGQKAEMRLAGTEKSLVFLFLNKTLFICIICSIFVILSDYKDYDFEGYW